MKNYVIAISGTTGAGKSTLVESVADLLKDSVTLYFDAYQKTTVYPPDMMERLSKGETVSASEIKCEELYQDIVKLKSGIAIVDPWGRKLESKKYIVIEEPFGRLREGMDEVIDFVAFINIPSDISLARRLLRDIQQEYRDLEPEKKLSIVSEYLTQYVNGLGIGYKAIDESSKNADIILDGLDSIEDNTLKVYNEVKNLFI